MKNTRDLSIRELEHKLYNEELTFVQLKELKNDSRRGARQIWERYCKNQEKVAKEKIRLFRLFRLERILAGKGYAGIAGVDEAGRGPLAGPVVAAAVILPELTYPSWEGLNDSKKLSSAFRENLYERIMKKAIAVGVGRAEVEEIDLWNIHQATLMAMERAVLYLNGKVDFALVDGRALPSLPVPQRPVKKGDAWCASIAAASIVAKVTRDRLMEKWDSFYPQYGFRLHKGYATSKHRRAIEQFGPTTVHRRSFLENLNF